MIQERVMKSGFGLLFGMFIWMLIVGVRDHNSTISIVAFVGLFGSAIMYGVWKLYQLLFAVGVETMEARHQIQGLSWYTTMRDDHPEELEIYKKRFGSVVCGCPNCRSKQKEVEELVSRKHMEQAWGEDDAGEDNVFDRS